MLEVRDLSLVRGGFSLAADFIVPAGARVAVIGPSGGGKSTLLAAIGGFVRPGAGRILWQGQDLTDLPVGARPITTLFQDNNLFPHLTVAQNVGLGIRPDLRLDAAERSTVAQALERAGLSGLGPRLPGSLSGGQRARVALARVLVMRRPLILLDEAFGGLGPALRAEMLDLVGALVAELQATALMVTHDPQDARRFAQECIVVLDGVAHPPQPTAGLLDNPPPGLARYLGTK